MPRRPVLAAVTALSVAVTTALLGAGGASAAPPPDRPTAGDAQAIDGRLDGKLARDLVKATGPVTAFVQLDAKSGSDVTAEGGSTADVKAAAADTEALAAEVVPQQATARSASAAPKQIATLTNLVAGTLVTGDAAQVRALADSPDVVAVYRVTPKTVDNANSVEFTRALQVWQDTGQTGEGVRVGVIDTGLDYTHADFGGPGTLEAYEAAYGADGSGPIPEGLYDPAKFIGGYDFAGPLYDADPDSELPGATTVPAPDENPIDSTYLSDNSGHGTHVSGTAAGYGVLPDGTTFEGDYAGLTDVSDWRVGPGTAPGAGIYALKVFGDIGGSTNLTSLALDRAADPNADGDLSDRLDVVNMSLGSDGSPADDPDNLLIAQLTALGTVMVMSAGNAGDITDIGGSPGNAPSALTVANSVGAPQTYDGVEVLTAANPALVGIHSGQNSVAYGGPDVTAPVGNPGANFDGCTAFTAAQAAAVAGKIAYLWWNDDDTARRCGSAVRFNNATAAGAVGVLLPTELIPFAAGIAGNAAIPGFQMTASTTDALLPEIEAGTLTVRIGPGLSGTVVEDIAGDMLNSGSSRGVHGSLGHGKPDVAAPGTQILSAASGAGTDSNSLSGTSMSSPHVAGIAALVRAAHPSWEAAQVKSAVVNTATHDIWTGPDGTGTAYGPERVGAGRVDAFDAVATDVIAYNTQNPDQTSVAWGVVEVGAETVVATKTVTVKNFGTTSKRYTTAVTSSSTAGGATITASPASITLAAGRSAIVTLTLTADPTTLERELDPTSAELQAGVPREYVAEVSGRLVLTSGAQELRVPLQAAPKLVSDLTASPVAFADAAAATADLAISGRGVAAGGWYSLTTPLNLAATSPKLEDVPGLRTSPSATAAGDIRYVGWASTAPQIAAAGGDPSTGLLGIGIATDGEWATLGQYVIPVIDIDIDGDGAYDLETVVQKLNADSDVTVAATFDYNTGENLDLQPVNGFFGDIDTGVFDSNVLVAPIGLEWAGIPAGSTPTIDVWTYSDYAADETGVLDSAESFTVNPYDPPFWFDNDIPGSFSTLGDDGVTIPVHKGTGAADGQLLVFQHHNADPVSRVQLVDVTVPTPTATTTTLAVTGGKKAGQELTLKAGVAPAEATGTVTFLDGQTEIGSAPVTNGKASIKVKLGAGAHSLSAAFASDTGLFAPSTSAVVPVDVAKSTSTTTLSLSRTSAPYGSTTRAAVVVRGETAPPTGTVEIKDRGVTVATGTLTVTGLRGVADVVLPGTLAAGNHHLTAVYSGNADVSGSQAQRWFTVTPVASTVSLSSSTWTVAKGTQQQVTVKVTGPKGAPTPTGSVVVMVGLSRVATVPLTAGTATVTLPAAQRSGVVMATYKGDAGYLPTAASHTLTVQR
ncbi:S8 family serine peptidase [uncultured Cellulomonas sp.]|uniref:S8 family serine peptidase n=1 Tax=uncultured Cellulomonas sp. TaxID=189682 RepID=UPI0028E1D8E0|nr:S8 family serine peptidase [uncultured Cellulomonas sp.]